MNTKHMQLAANMALKSVSKFRVGAVVARRHRVISTGFNDMGKSHPIVQEHAGHNDFVCGMHAEIHACLGVSAKDLYKSDLYVARILRNGEKALAKPCEICHSYLTSVGIRRVWYTNTSSEVGELSL